jgi:hypothetical protein
MKVEEAKGLNIEISCEDIVDSDTVRDGLEIQRLYD